MCAMLMLSEAAECPAGACDGRDESWLQWWCCRCWRRWSAGTDGQCSTSI